MDDHVYRVIDLVGSSSESVEDAIRNALRRASSTLREIGWFEVTQTRGHVVDGEIGHFQVVLKVGFRVEDGDAAL
ncbi:dodecin [Enemella sp. A6]|uniref:dodecin n=1 Tax=Enemella sp. A6 TaxID=3440152 RepID=UPI003EBB75F6